MKEKNPFKREQSKKVKTNKTKEKPHKECAEPI